MYLLAGFIQLLLILSQSDYLPDLSAVWNKESKPVLTVPAQATGQVWLVPGTVPDDVPKQALTGNNRNKWILSPALPSKGPLLIPPSHTLPAGRMINADKLYLLFCRLKIGG